MNKPTTTADSAQEAEGTLMKEVDTPQVEAGSPMVATGTQSAELDIQTT